jgi:putative copper export protein
MLVAEMRWLSPKAMIWVGALLMVMGVVLPFLMVIKKLESTFFLNFLSYGASVAGMLMATVGLAYTAISNRNKRR